MMKLGPKLRLLLLILAMLVGCVQAPGLEKVATPTPLPTPLVPDKPLYTVQRGDVVTIVENRARIIPVTEEDLYFRTDGFVRQVYAGKGDLVTEGQVIADLEGLADLERQLALQAIQVQKAEVHLENARLSLQIYEETNYTNSGYKQLELQKLQNEVKLAELSLEEARLYLEDLSETIDKSRLTAPFDGKLLSFSLDPGDAVEAYKRVVTVGDITTLEAAVELSDANLKSISAGMTVEIEPLNRFGAQYTGIVRRLPSRSQSGDVADKDKSVRIELDAAASAALALGDTVLVRLVLAKREAVLWLPPQAIRSFGGRKFVVIQTGEGQRSVDVKLGIESIDRVEIVFIEGQENLEEGQIVVGP